MAKPVALVLEKGRFRKISPEIGQRYSRIQPIRNRTFPRDTNTAPCPLVRDDPTLFATLGHVAMSVFQLAKAM